jgi:hypothetical protein
LPQTPVAIELQIAVEYLGQNCHFVYLAPLWKSVLDFDMRVDNDTSLVGRDLITGKKFGHKLGGSAGVANVGGNVTWVCYLRSSLFVSRLIVTRLGTILLKAISTLTVVLHGIQLATPRISSTSGLASLSVLILKS